MKWLGIGLIIGAVAGHANVEAAAVCFAFGGLMLAAEGLFWLLRQLE